LPVFSSNPRSPLCRLFGVKDAILNLEKGHVTPVWGRIIRKVPRCSMGRAVLPSTRSRRPRAVIRPTNPLRLPGSFTISTNVETREPGNDLGFLELEHQKI